MGDLRDRGDVGDLQAGVTRRLDPDQAGFAIDGAIPGSRIGVVFDETELNVAAFGKDRRSLFVALAKSVQGGDHVIAGAGDGEDQIEQSLRAGTGSYGALAPFERSQTLLQYACRGGFAAPIDVIGEFIE